MKDKFWMWLAWKLPKELVARTFCRVVGYATTGKYGDTEVPALNVMNALKRWMEN
jgi:hypothetical protein